MFIGILFGIMTACFQASAYFFSRHFLARHGSPLMLLVASQLILGLISLAVFPLTTPFEVLHWSLAGPLLLCTLCFIAGQICFFQALRRIESSRIASLTGLKVLLVPVFLYLFFGYHYNSGQIVALSLTLPAAALMNYQKGGKFQLDGIGYLLLAVTFYAWSDIGVRMLVVAIGLPSTLHAALIATNLNNLLVALLMIPGAVMLKLKWQTVRDSFYYALCWGGGILCFFVCFGYLGAAFGNVVQALRGPISLAAGLLLAHLGHAHLETKAPRAVWIRRGIAAAMMFGAIALYALSTK